MLRTIASKWLKRVSKLDGPINIYFLNSIPKMITLNSTFFSSEFFIAFTLPRAPSSIWISSEREKRDHYWPWVVPQKSSTHLRAQQHHSAENHKMRFHLWILIFIALATDNSVEGRRRKKGLWYKKSLFLIITAKYTAWKNNFKTETANISLIWEIFLSRVQYGQSYSVLFEQF